MAEHRIPLTEARLKERRMLLRRKRFGMRAGWIALFPAGTLLIYLAQREQPSTATMLVACAGMTVLFLAATLLYRRFSARLEQDLHSAEAVMETAIIRRIVQYSHQRGVDILFETESGPLTLSMIQLRRLVPDQLHLERLLPGMVFELEYTPCGRHLMRVARV